MAEGAPLPVIEGLALAGGVFAAHVAAPEGAPPGIDLAVGGEVVGRAALAPIAAGGFRLSAPLPAAALADGVQTVVFRERATGAVLGRYVLRAGDALDGDVAAALGILEGELAALKRAFMAEAADLKLRAAERPLIVAEAAGEALRLLAAERAGQDEGAGPAKPGAAGRGRAGDG